MFNESFFTQRAHAEIYVRWTRKIPSASNVKWDAVPPYIQGIARPTCWIPNVPRRETTGRPQNRERPG